MSVLLVVALATDKIYLKLVGPSCKDKLLTAVPLGKEILTVCPFDKVIRFGSLMPMPLVPHWTLYSTIASKLVNAEV